MALEDFDKLVCLEYPPYAFINTELPKQIELPDNFYVIQKLSKEWYKWFKKEQIRRIKMNKLREILYDESGKTAEFLRKCHEELKVKKGCSTCKNIRHVIDYPGFVTGEENECTAGLTCDTVLFSVIDCPRWEEQELKGENK